MKGLLILVRLLLTIVGLSVLYLGVYGMYGWFTNSIYVREGLTCFLALIFLITMGVLCILQGVLPKVFYSKVNKNV